jgi:nitroimidazol reductase NimA-like FMN-containing flavoprotein (pyridoxamine 5'-phosphate oxidase superfamily)
MDLQVIPRDEALRLLASAPVGRVVFTLRALPAVLPVNFVLDDDAVVIRTSPGSKLTAAVRNAIVAFQVDEIDPETHAGWSVLVTGRAREIRDPAEVARLRPKLQPWASGEREHLIRIPAELVSGRRLVFEPLAVSTPNG